MLALVMAAGCGDAQESGRVASVETPEQAPAPKSGTFRGRTSQGRGLRLLLDGRYVYEFAGSFRWTCDQLPPFSGRWFDSEFGIERDGALSSSVRVNDAFRRFRRPFVFDGRRRRGFAVAHLRLSGRFIDPTRATGAWRIRVRVYERSAPGRRRLLDGCDTGPVRWTVRHAP